MVSRALRLWDDKDVSFFSAVILVKLHHLQIRYEKMEKDFLGLFLRSISRILGHVSSSRVVRQDPMNE